MIASTVASTTPSTTGRITAPTPALLSSLSAALSSPNPRSVAGSAGSTSVGSTAVGRSGVQLSTTRYHAHRSVTIKETIVGGESTFSIDGVLHRFATLGEARGAANAIVFKRKTGISDSEVLSLYLSADLNRNGYMSWKELEVFQHRIDRTFRYTANDLALRPDTFLDAGGGDCEDWSLVTAGLCRFWDWEAYIGLIGPEQGMGHAVCLIRMNPRADPLYSFFRFDNWMRFGDKSFREGYYVPVDYGVVGGLTNAVERGWKLRNVYVPEEIYGEYM